MSDVTFFGDQNSLVTGHEFTLNEDKKGLWTGTQKYFSHRGSLIANKPERGDVHPSYDFLHMESCVISGMEGDWVEITAQYVGSQIPPGGGGGGGGGANDVDSEYGLRQRTREEPLGTAPFYSQDDTLTPEDIKEATEAASNPAKNQDGTVKLVDTDGWPDKKLNLYNKIKLGYDRYLARGVEFYMRYVEDEMPDDLDELQKVADPAPPNAPPQTDGSDWLLIGYNVVERAGVFDIEKVWLLSDPGGWDEDIYKDEVAAP